MLHFMMENFYFMNIEIYIDIEIHFYIYFEIGIIIDTPMTQTLKFQLTGISKPKVHTSNLSINMLPFQQTSAIF